MIKFTLHKFGLSCGWLCQGAGTGNLRLKTTINQLICDQFTQKWSSEMYDSNKCFNHRIFKEILQQENYLNSFLDNLRIAFTKFRCRNVNIPTEYVSCRKKIHFN